MQKISRKDEELIPQFNSHEEAKSWFEDRYGKDFILNDIEYVGDERCYFYHLILDWEEYKRGQKELKENGYMAGMSFLMSYQPVEIMENGGVHIVH